MEFLLAVEMILGKVLTAECHDERGRRGEGRQSTTSVEVHVLVGTSSISGVVEGSEVPCLFYSGLQAPTPAKQAPATLGKRWSLQSGPIRFHIAGVPPKLVRPSIMT